MFIGLQRLGRLVHSHCKVRVEQKLVTASANLSPTQVKARSEVRTDISAT
jgi:hypothetical protein